MTPYATCWPKRRTAPFVSAHPFSHLASLPKSSPNRSPRAHPAGWFCSPRSKKVRRSAKKKSAVEGSPQVGQKEGGRKLNIMGTKRKTRPDSWFSTLKKTRSTRWNLWKNHQKVWQPARKSSKQTVNCPIKNGMKHSMTTMSSKRLNRLIFKPTSLQMFGEVILLDFLLWPFH